MDIHRCRFIPYPSSAINALAFSHPSNPGRSGNKLKTLRLAVGRANGDIEIWNPQGGDWSQESILRGGKSRSVEALVWTQDPIQRTENDTVISGKLRLFSIGYSTVITEWDLALGRPIRHCNGNFGEIWCVAAQPRPDDSIRASSRPDMDILPAQQLVIGCADGTLVLLSTADEDLRFLRPIGRSSKKKSRVLSVTFLNREKIVAGYADSSIRVFATEKGQVLGTMTLGKNSRDATSAVLVWTIKVLADQTIVSGDSSGQITFWDGRTFTRLQCIQCHVADILDLAVSADGNTVVSAGMDRKSVFYQRPPRPTGEKSGKGGFYRWTETLHRRYHDHDVKVMASYESRDLSVVASGGVDTTPIVIPFREFATEYHRKLPYLEQRPPLQSAPSKRLIMSWWGQEVNIWRLGRRRETAFSRDFSFEADERTKRTLILRMLMSGEENIASASLAFDGSILAVATMAEVKIFRLRKSKTNRGVLRAQKIDLPSDLVNHGARLLCFSPDSKWLAVADSANSLYLYRIFTKETAGPTVQVLKRRVYLERLSPPQIQRKPYFGHHGTYDRSVSHIAFSDDSRILVSASLDGKMDSWVLEGYEELTLNGETSLSNGFAKQPDETGDGMSDHNYDDDEYDDDDAQHSQVILGQCWVRNPAPALPLLPSAPLILSFRGVKLTSTRPAINGNIGLHQTRHNAHPHSHDLPTGEDRFLVVTSEHGIYEYNALTGKLSDWSRRNSRNLPSNFLRNRDRVMGSLWDTSDDCERLWLYGASWLCVFDLAKDFPVELSPASKALLNGDSGTTLAVNGTNDGQEPSKKRKRGQTAKEMGQDIPARGSGGGSRAHQGDSMLGIKDEYRISHGPDLDNASYIQMIRKFNPLPGDEDLSEDDEEDVARHGASSTLVRSRRSGQISSLPGGHLSDSHDTGDTADEDRRRSFRERKRPENRAFWDTQRYRPILGIVRLGGGEDSDADDVDMIGADWKQPSKSALEVALVERPLWDLDLPARFT